MPIVELENVTCGYDRRAVVSNINLQVMPGEFVGLLGPSGSGKTTLLRAILGAVDVYEGQVTIAGAGVKQRKNRIGYVPQIEDINWDFPVTVEEAVLMGRTMSGPLFPWFGRADRELAQTTMERMGIGHLAKRHIRRLSGGEQQRVFLARALISNPRLLLLDETHKGGGHQDAGRGGAPAARPEPPRHHHRNDDPRNQRGGSPFAMGGVPQQDYCG